MPVIKELAGHSSIVTTQRYVHMSPDNLKDAISALEKDSGLQSADRGTVASCGAERGVAHDVANSGYQIDRIINDLRSGG